MLHWLISPNRRSLPCWCTLGIKKKKTLVTFLDMPKEMFSKSKAWLLVLKIFRRIYSTVSCPLQHWPLCPTFFNSFTSPSNQRNGTWSFRGWLWCTQPLSDFNIIFLIGEKKMSGLNALENRFVHFAVSHTTKLFHIFQQQNFISSTQSHRLCYPPLITRVFSTSGLCIIFSLNLLPLLGCSASLRVSMFHLHSTKLFKIRWNLKLWFASSYKLLFI